MDTNESLLLHLAELLTHGKRDQFNVEISRMSFRKIIELRQLAIKCRMVLN